MNQEVQRRLAAIRDSGSGAVLCAYFKELLDQEYKSLVVVTPDRVQRHQGKAEQLLSLIKFFETRE